MTILLQEKKVWQHTLKRLCIFSHLLKNLSWFKSNVLRKFMLMLYQSWLVVRIQSYSKVVPIKHLVVWSISKGEGVMWTEGPLSWMQPIIVFLKDHTILENKEEANKLRRKVAHYVLQDEVLYKKWFSSPLFWCIGGEEASYVLRKVDEGVCSNRTYF